MSVRQILVAGVKVGLVGLDEILEQVKAMQPMSDDETAQKLLELTSKQNYMTPSRREDHKCALLREFKRFMGEDVPPNQAY